MLKRCLPAAVLTALLVPSMAAADPVTITVHSTEGGGSAVLLPLPGSTPLFIGDVRLPTPDSAVILSITGLAQNTNYLMHMLLYGASTWNALRAEVLDPLDDDDADDVVPYHAGVPAGYSTSNRFDGFSFAQGGGIQRSATWAGGSATVTADEQTHAADLLMFTGLAGTDDAIRVSFGLRDWHGGRNFLVRLSAEGGMAATPEPASMFLIGTGLAGLAAIRRRRQARG